MLAFRFLLFMLKQTSKIGRRGGDLYQSQFSLKNRQAEMIAFLSFKKKSLKTEVNNSATGISNLFCKGEKNEVCCLLVIKCALMHLFSGFLSLIYNSKGLKWL